MAQQSVGIVAYGSYIPATRLPLAMIHGGRAKEGGPEKAVAGFDEDAITMAVAAAADCLAGVERHTVDGVYFATTTSPFSREAGGGVYRQGAGFTQQYCHQRFYRHLAGRSGRPAGGDPCGTGRSGKADSGGRRRCAPGGTAFRPGNEYGRCGRCVPDRISQRVGRYWRLLRAR